MSLGPELTVVTEEKLLEQIGKMDERIATFKVQMSDRNNLKDVALGTSKYVSPSSRVTLLMK